jgi:ribosome-binding protein aMBF1 (putative translation factor)
VRNNKIIKILPVQCRAARAMLGWGQQDLASKVPCAKKTITDFEKSHSTPYDRTLRDIQETIEEAGIVFINDGEIGVKMDSKSTDK